MAKTQNLSLNPTKISGTCGRLMCCLKYEQDTYESLIRSSPKVESFVDTPEGRGTVVETEILRQRVKVQMENNPDTVNVFSNEDIAVLRNGKAKKNDPPIPADLAPISGGGKRPPKPKEEDSPILEPIRFRYSTETIVEESAPAPQQEAEQRPPRQRRRRGSRPEIKEAPEQSEAKQPEKQPGQEPKPRQRREQKPRRQDKPEQKEGEQPKEIRPSRPPKKAPAPQADAAPAADGDAKKPRHRPNHYRHRKPKAPQS